MEVICIKEASADIRFLLYSWTFLFAVHMLLVFTVIFELVCLVVEVLIWDWEFNNEILVYLDALLTETEIGL